MTPATLKIERTPAEGAAPLRHNAPRSGSTTLNHVRGPSAAVELDQRRHERTELVARLKALNAEIADAELLALVADAGVSV